MRANHIKDFLIRHQNSLKFQSNEHISSISNSPTRINHQNKRNHILKPSKTISLVSLNNTENEMNKKKPI
jgi:hypothetical protein